ncbi:hypothetical protein K0M31_014684 [Melipona bicolor]|uniref:Uncharacterized protein n=1 Tax=Melipona bicolor TaxID=60889 RepID=A0AA40KFY7_9HYME|nr:hypothetical protein K0M31_014684 [Melipona bicolor]
MADSGIKRNIPIKLGDFSVIDTEFSNIRERFDAEMRKMEDEMSRFRSELMNRESNNFFKSTTREDSSSLLNIRIGIHVELRIRWIERMRAMCHGFCMPTPQKLTVVLF